MKKLASLILALMLVLACLAGVAFAADAEASWTDGTATQQGTLVDMVKLVSEKGGTLTLLKDVEMNDEKKAYAITTDSPMTLDLNGHILYSVTRGVRVTGKKSVGVVTITDSVGGGALMSDLLNCNIENGGFVLQNAVFWSLTQQNIAYYETSDQWNGVNLIENCTLVNSAWGPLAFNRTDGQSMAAVSVTLRNCALANAKLEGGPCVVAQSKAQGGNVVLEDGVMFYTYATAETKMLPSGIKATGDLKRVEGKYTLKLLHLDGREYMDMNLWATPGADPAKLAPGLKEGLVAKTPVDEDDAPIENIAPTQTEAPKVPGQSSTAVIGGADGPTTVTVAVRPIVWVSIAVVLLCAVVVIVVVKKKK